MHCSTVSTVTETLPSSLVSPLSTAISRVDSALRASPFANPAIAAIHSSDIAISVAPNPRTSASARFKSPTSSSVLSACNTNTLQRDRSAPLTSNDGFSVVAPIRIMLPFSTNGKNASCCALLNLCISSTNSTVFSPNRLFFSACSITCLISFIPLVTAEKSMNLAFVPPAIMRASVVLPTPGGPQKNIEPILSPSIIRRSTLPLPKSCSCPKNSSRLRGLSLAASGSGAAFSKIVRSSCITFSVRGYPRFMIAALSTAAAQAIGSSAERISDFSRI